MHNFLKSRMLWHYCIGEITILVKGASEEDATFLGRMIEHGPHMDLEHFHFLHLQFVGQL